MKETDIINVLDRHFSVGPGIGLFSPVKKNTATIRDVLSTVTGGGSPFPPLCARIETEQS
jgi:hypothetical protein